MNRLEEKLMNPPTSEEVTEKSLAAAVDSEVRDFEEESTKSAPIAHSKVGIDAERIRSAIARLTSNSTDELEELVAAIRVQMESLSGKIYFASLTIEAARNMVLGLSNWEPIRDFL